MGCWKHEYFDPPGACLLLSYSLCQGSLCKVRFRYIIKTVQLQSWVFFYSKCLSSIEQTSFFTLINKMGKEVSFFLCPTLCGTTQYQIQPNLTWPFVTNKNKNFKNKEGEGGCKCLTRYSTWNPHCFFISLKNLTDGPTDG